MSQALHIFWKDVRRLRWWLALWATLLAARVLLAAAGALGTSEGLVEQIVIEQVKTALGIATLVLFGVLVARLVQDEPLVGPDWFWLTRPYDRSSLLGAKLAFAALFFLLLPLGADLAVMAAFGATPWDMLRGSSVFLARDARWTLGLMVFAVMSATLVGFALGLAGTVAALALALTTMLAVAMLRMPEATRPSDAPADATPAIVATAVFILACLAVIAYQYFRRRRGRALALAAIGVAAVAVVPSIWPWPIARRDAVAPPPWAQDPESVAVVVDRTAPPGLSDEPPFRRRDGRRRHVSLPVELTGLPAGYRPQGTFAESRLELRDGDVLESQQPRAVVGRLALAGGEPAHELQGVLGSVRVLPVMHDAAMRRNAALLTVTDQQLARHGPEPGRLIATLHIPLQHSRVIGTLPLAEGVVFRRDGMQIELVRVQQRHDGCTILLRQWRVRSILSSLEYRQHEFLLRNVQRQEAYAGNVQHRGFAASSVGSLMLYGLVSAIPGSEGFSIEHVWMDYPQRWGAQAERSTIDAQWLAAADLVIVETAHAGVITRTIVLDDFMMQGASGD